MLFVSKGEGLISWGWSQDPNVVTVVTSFLLATYRPDKKGFECWPVSKGQLRGTEKYVSLKSVWQS